MIISKSLSRFCSVAPGKILVSQSFLRHAILEGMKDIYDMPTPSTPKEVVDYFLSAVEYRNSHKSQSIEIARYVFDVTHESRIGFHLSEKLERIRYEFGALEAPGTPDGGEDVMSYDDRLWERLAAMINEKRTV